MISRTTFLAAALAACSMLMGCSADDGRPTSGPGSGTSTGGGQNGEEGTGTETGTGATTPAPSASTTQTTGAKKAAIEACTKDDDCASGVCYVGDQGSYCSAKCTADTAATACVAPFAGTCNKKGYCKKP
jgi:hypothetical protein